MKIRKHIIIIAMAFVLLIPLSVQDSFAESEKVDIFLVFVSYEKGCNDQSWDIVRSVTSITRKYLYQWNITPGLSDWYCIVKEDLSFTVEQAKSTHDLTVLILDNQVAEEWLYYNSEHPRGGHYMGGGGYDVVVTPSPRDETEDDDEWSVYVLVQELSHFAVEWYGYPCDISNADSCVHRHQDRFDECNSYGTPDVCLAQNLLTRVDSQKTGKNYDVMSPLFTEPYVPPTIPIPTPSKTTEKHTTFANWVTTGKTVNDNQYISLEGSIWGNTEWDGRWAFVKHQSVAFYNSETFIGRDTTDSQGNFEFSAWLPDGRNTFSVKYSGSDEWYGSTTQGPTFTVIEKQIVGKKTPVNVKLDLWKLQDEYGKYEGIWIGGYFSKTHDSESSPKLDLYQQTNNGWKFVKSKYAKLDGTSFNTNLGYAGTYENGYYKVVVTHYSNIAEKNVSGTKFFSINSSSKLSPTFFSEPVKMDEIWNVLSNYQNTIDSFQNPETKKFIESAKVDGTNIGVSQILKNYEEIKIGDSVGGWEIHFSSIDSIIEQAKIIEKEYQIKNKIILTDSDKDGVIDSQDACKNTNFGSIVEKNGCIANQPCDDYDNDGICNDIDRCPNSSPNSDGYGCPDKTKIEKEKQEKIFQANEELKKQLKGDVAILKTQSNDELLELKKGVQVAQEALKKLNPSSDNKETVDKAWDLLKINQQKIVDIQKRVEKGDRQFGYGLYENAKSFYNLKSSNNQEIGANLEEISKLIEEANPKTCFLFWCW